MDGWQVHQLSSWLQRTLAAVCPYITAKDNNHIEQILLDGCLAESMFTKPLDNKLKMIRQGNLKSFNDNPVLVRKAMNKEDWYSHLVPINEDIFRASGYLRHTIQMVVMKLGKKRSPCLGWNNNPSHSRHCDEPSHASHSWGSHNVWPRLNSIIHWHLQHVR